MLTDHSCKPDKSQLTDGRTFSRQRYFMVEARPGPWQYHSEVLTDQSPEDMCTNILREKLLEYLPQEVPYSLTQVTEEPAETSEDVGRILKLLFNTNLSLSVHRTVAGG